MTADYTAYLESVLRDREGNVRKRGRSKVPRRNTKPYKGKFSINGWPSIKIGLKRTYSQGNEEELQGRIFSGLRGHGWPASWRPRLK
ncbi:MAG: hypothetical protein ACLUD2_20540 [Clostridium sp.]